MCPSSSAEIGANLSVRLADERFSHYVLDSDYRFEVSGYANAVPGQAVDTWTLESVEPYSKCYGIDPEEFSAYLGKPDSAIFVAWWQDQPVGHVVVSSHWNGLAYVDELAVDARVRRAGVGRALLEVVRFWALRKHLPGVMLETQNNNLAACRLYEREGYQLGGVDRLRYRGIDPLTREVALFWYLLFDQAQAQAPMPPATIVP